MYDIKEKDLPKLINSLKKYAKNKGLNHDEIDDFSQEAAFSLFRGRKASFKQLFIDFLRKTYGDTRIHSNVTRSRQTRFYEDLDENVVGGDLRDGQTNFGFTGSLEEILKALTFNEIMSLNDNDKKSKIFSQARKSQLKKSAKQKIKMFLDLQHGYHLMETDDLWINYIEIS